MLLIPNIYIYWKFVVPLQPLFSWHTFGRHAFYLRKQPFCSTSLPSKIIPAPMKIFKIKKKTLKTFENFGTSCNPRFWDFVAHSLFQNRQMVDFQIGHETFNKLTRNAFSLKEMAIFFKIAPLKNQQKIIIKSATRNAFSLKKIGIFLNIAPIRIPAAREIVLIYHFLIGFPNF